jgi:putative phosphoribosyl transferase
MTMAAAAYSLKARQPTQVWIATPVAPKESIEWLQQWGDRIIVLSTPSPFLSVSRFYAEFPQVETDAVLAYLQQYNVGEREEGERGREGERERETGEAGEVGKQGEP